MKDFDLKKVIRNVPDFPIKGIVFRDITTLVKDSEALHYVLDKLYERYRDKKIDQIVAIESRGFIFGGALADRLGCGFIPARKAGKLPAAIIEEKYDLEYGTASLQIHSDAVAEGQHVIIIDDLLATGGTLCATAKLVEALGGIVDEIAVIIELSFLKGREKLKKYSVYSMVEYESE